MAANTAGFDFIEEIKKDPHLEEIPLIVYVTEDLSKKDEAHLKRLGQTMNLKEVRSPERLLDETALFLHSDVAKLPEARRGVDPKPPPDGGRPQGQEGIDC